MKIYTKKGDAGQTSLIGGKRVSKHHLRIEAYGTVDELNSWVGYMRGMEISERQAAVLVEAQDRLFTMGSLLAEDAEGSKMELPQLSEADIEKLEQEIDFMNETLPEMRSFVLPGGHLATGAAHIARCVCRRAERCVIALSETETVDAKVLAYLNRFSDYLFVLSRKLSFDLNAAETPWVPKM